MKKSLPVSAAVFDFLFGAFMLVASVYTLTMVLHVFTDLQSLMGVGSELLLVLILIFPFAAMFYLAFVIMGIICIIGFALGVFAIVSGVFLIRGAVKANYKTVKKFALAQVIIQSIAIVISGFTLLISLVRFAETSISLYGFETLIFSAVMLTAAIGVTLNSVCLSRQCLTPKPVAGAKNAAHLSLTERGQELLRLLNAADLMQIGYVLNDEHVTQAQRLDAMLDRCRTEQDVEGLIKNVFKSTAGLTVAPDRELVAQIYAIKR